MVIFDSVGASTVSSVVVNKKGAVTNAVELTAKWAAKSYEVAFELNGGAVNSSNITSYVFGEGATLPNDVTKTGYTFKGWFDNETKKIENSFF